MSWLSGRRGRFACWVTLTAPYLRKDGSLSSEGHSGYRQDLSRSQSNRRILSSRDQRDVISSVDDLLYAFEFPLRMFSKFWV
ncbi:hypothetical protein NDU88_007522 [Pleurodeles waltl]|uniref:Uncharacterized protein n=1 Tax=Pleurodeles waltl TaxID=8319 RepID=A0AAV7NV71_PLEWA|nr:hypothetical protein NDU88_007522 [Pleurodeles waltl]